MVKIEGKEKKITILLIREKRKENLSISPTNKTIAPNNKIIILTKLT